MNSLKSRLHQLEKQIGAQVQPWPALVAMMKPSEILSLADELIAAGAQPTEAQRTAIESLRQVTK